MRRAIERLGLTSGLVAPAAAVDALFDSFDRDGGGAIEYEELGRVLRREAEAEQEVRAGHEAAARVAAGGTVGRDVVCEEAAAAAAVHGQEAGAEAEEAPRTPMAKGRGGEGVRLPAVTPPSGRLTRQSSSSVAPAAGKRRGGRREARQPPQHPLSHSASTPLLPPAVLISPSSLRHSPSFVTSVVSGASPAAQQRWTSPRGARRRQILLEDGAGVTATWGGGDAQDEQSSGEWLTLPRGKTEEVSDWTRKAGISRNALSVARAEAVLDGGTILTHPHFANAVKRSSPHSALSRGRIVALNSIESAVDDGQERDMDRRVLQGGVRRPRSIRGFSVEAHTDPTASASPRLPYAVGDEDDDGAFVQGAAAACTRAEYDSRRARYARAQYEASASGQAAHLVGQGARGIGLRRQPGLPKPDVPTRTGEPARDISLDSPIFASPVPLSAEREAALLASTELREGEKARRDDDALASSAKGGGQGGDQGEEPPSAQALQRMASLASNLFGAKVAAPEEQKRAPPKPPWDGGQKKLFSDLHARHSHERRIALEEARSRQAGMAPSSQSAAQILTRYKAGGDRILVDEEAASRAEAMRNFIGKWMEKRGIEAKSGPVGFRTSGKPGSSPTGGGGAWAALAGLKSRGSPARLA